MRGLKKSYMKRGHHSNIETSRKERNKHTSRLLDQLGPEGRVGENHVSKRPLNLSRIANNSSIPEEDKAHKIIIKRKG